MFTGLIQGVGAITSVRKTRGGFSLHVRPDSPFHDLQPGESVCISGVCLSVAAGSGESLALDLSSETASRTTLAAAPVGRRVNLERALRPVDRLGGHIVTGHVDCVGRCTAARERGEFSEMEFEIPTEHARYIAQKGSVAVDGVSLTVASVTRDRFAVAVIPVTLAHTTLAGLAAGDAVNLETDVLAKYVERLLSCARGSVPAQEDGRLMQLLREQGFAS